MRYAVLLVTIIALLTTLLPATAGDSDLGQLIPGTWTIAPNERTASGELTFGADGRYVMNETLKDGTGVGRKGEYRLDESTKPARIDLCLESCDQAGAEWTTLFCILRADSDDSLVLRSSEDGKYPAEFKADGPGTMVLSRVAEE